MIFMRSCTNKVENRAIVGVGGNLEEVYQVNHILVYSLFKSLEVSRSIVMFKASIHNAIQSNLSLESSKVVQVVLRSGIVIAVPFCLN